MKLNKAFKFRLYPTTEQAVLINKTFGCCRFVYNQMLAAKIKHYEETGKSLNIYPASLKEENQFLKEVDCEALGYTYQDLNKAYDNFFRGIKKKQNVGFPKFKSKKNPKRSYTTRRFKIGDGWVKLPKIGVVKCRTHREIPDGCVLKSGTISQVPTGKYYISLLFEYDYEIPSIQLNKENSLGIDYSVPGFYIDNQNEQPFEYHKLFKENEDKIAKQQRNLSRKKLHSNRWYKQKKRVDKIHEKISNKRKDFIEKLSTNLADTYDIICIEDLNLQDMAKSHNLGKSVHDAAFGAFRVILGQKLSIRGKKLIKIGKWVPSSTVCSSCGTKHKDIVYNMGVRAWICPDCGTYHDRDVNAAKNIRRIGLEQL